MTRKGQNLLELLVRRETKTAAVEVVRGGDRPEYRELGGARPTVLGGTGVSNPRSAAAYWKARNGQSTQRAALGSAWTARQSRVSPGVISDMQRVQHAQRSGAAAWRAQNADLLKQFPQLARHANYFAGNPKAWSAFQAQAGLTPQQQAQTPRAAQRPQATTPAVRPGTSAVQKPMTPAPQPKPQTQTAAVPKPAAQPKPAGGIATWTPGQNLPGMNAQQTAAYNAKAQKPGQQQTGSAVGGKTCPTCGRKMAELFIKRAQVTPPQPKTPALPEPSMAPAKMVTPKLRNADYGYNRRGYAGVDDPAGYTGPVKTGPLLARDEQNPFQAGVDRMLKEEARGPAPLTNQDYAQRFKGESDAMTDAQRQAQEQAYWQKQPIVQRKSDLAIIQGNRGMKTWGDRLDSVLGKGDPNAGVRTMRPVQGPKWWQTANQWADAGANMAKDVFSRETLHDIANNAQMATESVGKGAKDVWNLARRWLNPSMYGDSWDAKQNRMSLANDVANTETDYNDRMARIIGNSQTGLDDIKNSPLAMINAGAMMGAGQAFGGTAATAGAGALMRGAGTAVTGAGRLAGSGVGRAVAAGAQRVGMSAARAGAIQRHATGLGQAIGEAAGAPLRYAGNALGVASEAPAKAFGATAQALGATGRGAVAAGRAVGRAALHPVRTAQAVRGGIVSGAHAVGDAAQAVGQGVRAGANMVRHPLQTAGSAARTAWANKGMVWDGAKWVMRQPVDAARYAWANKGVVGKGLGKALDAYFYGQNAYDVASGVANGDYGKALGSAADTGFYSYMRGKPGWGAQALAIGVPLAGHALFGGSDDAGDYPEDAE